MALQVYTAPSHAHLCSLLESSLSPGVTSERQLSPLRARHPRLRLFFLSEVEAFEAVDTPAPHQISYTMCSSSLYRDCKESFKSTPDYQGSSTSIYKAGVLCVRSTCRDVKFVHSVFLSSKRSLAPYIQLEMKFKYTYSVNYINNGKLDEHTAYLLKIQCLSLILFCSNPPLQAPLWT